MRQGLAIFDLDGTLFQAETVTPPAVRAAFVARGLEPPALVSITNFIGRPDREFHAWMTELAGEDIGRALACEIPVREVEFVKTKGLMIPGAVEALTALRETVTEMVICTNGPEPYVQAVVESLRLAHFFDEVRWRRPEDTGKPQMVADLLGRWEARPAVVIGDRADDIEAARANGIYAIGAGYGFCQPGDMDGADAIAHSPAELPGIVERLFAGG